MSLELLTPQGAALAIVVVLPLASLAGSSRRAARARAVLGLADPGPAGAGPPIALLACAGLLALAAAQPILTERVSVSARNDAEAIVVVDTSRSMLAAAAPGEESRFDRAREGGARLAEALPEVPLGLASMTDRLLPHVFQTPRHEVYLGALERVLAVEQPPPRGSDVQISSLGVLAEVARGEFFSPESERRLLFVLTDGESRPFDQAGLERALGDAGVETILVHIWEPGEGVFGRGGRPELGYVPNPASAQIVAGLGSALGGAFGEEQFDEAVQAAKDRLGSGPVQNVGRAVGAQQLAPWVVLAALVPLGFLLWRRNLA